MSWIPWELRFSCADTTFEFKVKQVLTTPSPRGEIAKVANFGLAPERHAGLSPPPEIVTQGFQGFTVLPGKFIYTKTLPGRYLPNPYPERVAAEECHSSDMLQA